MSQWLNQVLENQRNEGGATESLEPCLLMESSGFRCGVSFEYLSEVIEMQRIVPYPESDSAHLGIINLRGEVIPVLRMESLVEINENTKMEVLSEGRLVIFNSSKGHFAVPVHGVKKIALPKDVLSSVHETEIDGRVYCLLGEYFFQTVERI